MIPSSICAAATISSTGPFESKRELWSHSFQWLPCIISFPDGENVQIDSYIDTLQPRDPKGLYHVIEMIITKAIPFWNIIYQSIGGYEPLETGLWSSYSGIHSECPDGVDEDPPEDFPRD